MGLFGTGMLAAHQIIFQTIVITFMTPLGISHATTIRVGQYFGRRDWQGVKRSAYIGIGLSIAFMACTTVVFLGFPLSIMGLYLDPSDPANANLIPLLLSMMPIAGVSQVFDGVQTTANGALRGLQDTKVPMLLSFGAFWLIGLSVGYVLAFRLGFGGVGLWMGQTTGVVLASIVFVVRFNWLLRRQRQRAMVE
jgi:multidrug resistance protein, MATE family